MSIYIEDTQFSHEVLTELALIAHPRHCDLSGRPMFLPSVSRGVAVGTTVESNKFFQLDYPAATHLPTDLGARLLGRLANYQPIHIFIHGAPSNFWLQLDARGNSVNLSQEGGGFTTDAKSSPHVDLYIDGSKENGRYTIDAKGLGSISERNPFVRLYHELLHAEGIIFGHAHGHWTVIPKTNDFCRQRKLGYERVLPPADWLLRQIRSE